MVMKGYSTTMIIGIIIAVIIGVVILYMFWSKGMLPFTTAASESQCKANLMSDCDKVSTMGGWDQVTTGDVAEFFSNIKYCGKFLGSRADSCSKGNIEDCKSLCESIGSIGGMG